MMIGYKRGGAQHRGAAALSPPASRSSSHEFRESNFEYAIRSFTQAQSSGSQSSEFERVSQPSIYSDLEARGSASGGCANEEFGRRLTDENSDCGEAFREEHVGPDTAQTPMRRSGPCFCMYCQMERERNQPARSARPQRDASTQTEVLPRMDLDQIFSSLVPRNATGVLGVGQRHYGSVGIFIAFILSSGVT